MRWQRTITTTWLQLRTEYNGKGVGTMEQNTSAKKKASDEVRLPGLTLSREEYEALKMEIVEMKKNDVVDTSGDINLPEY